MIDIYTSSKSIGDLEASRAQRAVIQPIQVLLVIWHAAHTLGAIEHSFRIVLLLDQRETYVVDTEKVRGPEWVIAVSLF